MIILYLIIAFILGLGISYLLVRPRLKTYQQLDIYTQEENKKIQERNEILCKTNDDLLQELSELKLQKIEISNSIAALQAQAKKSGEIFYEENMEIARTQFELSSNELSKKFQNHQKECQDEYLMTLNEAKDEFQVQLTNYLTELENIKIQIAEKEKEILNQKNVAAATIEANKRQMEEADKRNFYRLQLTAADLEEIEKLRSIAPMLRNREPLDKVIWKTYYEKPTADLLARIIGTTVKTGIYKITDIETGKIYVGQSVNISDRFKNHIKAGLGIDSSNNKLYSTMKEHGVENFYFEVLEECERALLNEKEKFWIDFYQSESFGMNSTKGNK